MSKQPNKLIPVRKEKNGERSYSYGYGYGYGYYGYGAGYQKEKRPRKLNWNVLFGSVMVAATMGAGLYFWHDHQLKQLSVALLERADEKESAEEWRDASNSLYRYWKITKDPEVLGRLAPVYDKASAKFDRPGVIKSYQRAIGRLPERLDLRVRLSELLYRDHQFGLALEQANKVLETDPDHPAGAKYRALAQTALFRKGEALDTNELVDELEATFYEQPTDFELAREFTRLIRVHMKADEDSDLGKRADAAMDQLVKACKGNPYAYVARHNYRTSFDLPGAKSDIETALAIAPQNPLVVQQAAWDAHRDTDYLAARQLFRQLIKLAPNKVNGYVGLGDAEFFSGNPRDAIRTWQLARGRKLTTLPLLIRLADAQLKLSQVDEAEETLDEADRYAAALLRRIDDVEDRNWAVASTSYFRGQLHVARGEIYKALPKLQLAASLGRDVTPHTRRGANSLGYSALMALGKGYTRLGRWEEAAVSYDRAVSLKPSDSRTLLASGRAWAKLGAPSQAADVAKLAIKQADANKNVLLDVAQYLFEQQLMVPSTQRTWTEFEKALAVAKERLTNSWQLRFLELDYVLHTSRDESRTLAFLLSIEHDFPNNVEVWSRLPLIYESIGQTAQTDRVLKRVEALTSSSPQTKILLADILLHRGQVDTAEAALAGLDPEQLLDIERWSFDLARLRIAEATRQDDLIDQELLSLAQQYPQEALPLYRLLDRRLAGVSELLEPTKEDLLETLRNRHGEADSGWQYYAARLELESASPRLEDVSTQLADLRNGRPYWSRTHELTGLVAERTGSLRSQDVRAAWEMSLKSRSPNPELLVRLIELYLTEHDFLSIWQLIDFWHENVPISRIIENGHWSQLQRKLDVANAQPHDASPEVALVYQQLIKPDVEAVQAFRQANPKSLLAWSLIWKHSVNDELPSEQTTLLEQLPNLAVSSGLGAYVSGQAFQYAGDDSSAIEQYAQIDRELEFRLQSEIYSGFATNSLAASTARLPSAVERLAVQQSNRSSAIRLAAIMKLRRGGKRDLAEARQMLERLVAQKPPESNDRLLFAQCLERLENPAEADEQLTSLVEDEPTGHHVATLAEFLLRRGELDRAGVWIDQLEDQSGETHHTVRLRARWLADMGRQAEITPLVEKFANSQLDEISNEELPSHLLSVASIYREVGLAAASQRWLEVLADRFPAYSPPVDYLVVEDDVTEASIQRCIEQLERRPSVETSLLLARILVYGTISEATLDRVQPILEETQERFPMNGSLLFALGNLKLKHGLIDEAIELLTKVTEVQPSHYLAWNNLAALLAEQEGKQAEAMEKIDKALEYAAYEVPTLLDTKAVVLMHSGRLRDAAELLQAEVTESQSTSDPRFYFHLALVLNKLADTEGAHDALNEAEDLGLDGAFLTSEEKKQLTALRNKFAPR